MERVKVFEVLQGIFQDVLDNDDLVITDQSSALEIEEWDSLAQIQLVVAIEKKFNIKFNAQEILSWKNVGEMVDCILQK